MSHDELVDELISDAADREKARQLEAAIKRREENNELIRSLLAVTRLEQARQQVEAQEYDS